MTANTQKINACHEIRPDPIHKLGDDLRFSTCIGNFFQPQIYHLLELHQRFEKGVMPYAGGMMDQPAKIIDVFEVITLHRAERAVQEEKKNRLINRQKAGRHG